MASSSSSDNYDVFLNFRGEDTRVSFTCHLYDALHRQKKIKTFIDDEELRRGDEISPALLNAIQGSKTSVVIFSNDYASSKWCLNELVKILECKSTNGQIVVPVFYSVSPSDVRHQTGIFGHGFDKLEQQQFKEKPEMVQKWRDALTETSHLAGHESTKFRHDAQLVDKIVEDVLKKLERITVSTNSSDGLVGLTSRIEQIKPLLCMDLSDTVQILGIWGMGGIGKTTLATAIFNQFSSEFEGRCFVSDVRRNSETGGGLEHLQKLIISTILSEKLEVTGPNIPQFTKERVRRMKALVVLDDVNKVRQLEGLIGGRDQYGPGSRIVVTTRDKRVLEKFRVEKIYRVNELEFGEAFELFCKFAFKENHCPEDLTGHSRRVVWYAEGNPLVLKLLGSSLCLKTKRHWENVLHDLNQICESDIHDIYDVLKISFNELTYKVKSIFLDIACFFEGEDKDFVTRILDDSGSFGLDVLVDKSLITVSNNCLQMHDLLQEMGREIVRRESEKEPGKRSRLWDPKEIRRVLKHNKGTDAIEGIFLDLSKIKGINLDSGVFKNVSNLRMLKFYVTKFLSIEEQLVQLPNDLVYLPKNLRYLHWYKYPLRTLPSNFEPKNIVELSLPFSKVEQIWEGKRKAFKLKFVDLSHSQHLIEIPDLSEIPNLERIYLSNCRNLVHVHSSIQNFKYLSRLNFRGCKSLRSFPNNLHFVCPVTINFSSCVNLIEFPQISGKITRLDLSWSAIEEIPPSIECLTDLKELRLHNCQRLKSISTSFCKLKSLEYLFLCGCLNLERFPEILEKMKHIECISLSGTAITELPSSFENLEGLAELFLHDCSKLDILPDNIGNLTYLRDISAVGSAISQLPSSVADSNDLQQFTFSGCRGLVSLPPLLLSGLSSVYKLDLDDCGLTAIPQEIGCLSSLEELNLSGNNFESLPASLKQLSRLHSLYLNGCSMLQSLPELPLCLQSLDARNCKLLQSLPEIRSYLEEVGASELEELSKHFREELPNRESGWMCPDPEPFKICFVFTNCLKLNEKANNKILADLRLRIQHMIIASLRPFHKRPKYWVISQEGCALDRVGIVLPGSKIPEWFCYQNSGPWISIQLPSHSFCRNLIGFAFCAVLDFKQFPSNWWGQFGVSCELSVEIRIRSETKNAQWWSRWARSPGLIDSDHVMLGFDPFVNVVFPDGNNHATVSFWFDANCYYNDYVQDYYEVKLCGVCPVYANPNETKPNTFTLSFATEVWKLDDLASASGTSDEEEL